MLPRLPRYEYAGIQVSRCDKVTVRFSLSIIISLFFDKESTEDNAVQYNTKNQIRSTDDEPLDSYATTFVRNER